MKLGIIALTQKNGAADYSEQFCALARYIVDAGLVVEFFTSMSANSDITNLLSLNAGKADAVIFFGGDDMVKAALDIPPDEFMAKTNGKFFAVLPENGDWTESFQTLVQPMLTEAPKAAYDEIIIKTFGLTEDDVKSRLREVWKSKKNIQIILKPSILECDVIIKYSGMIAKHSFDACLSACITALSDSVYGVGDTSLQKCIVQELMGKGRKLAIAESFTGGKVAGAIVSVPGASDVFSEGVIAYSDYAKICRLNVEPRIIERNGAVSNETAYLMATGLFSFNPDIDYVLATTGFAGPTGAKVGLCYIATGDRDNIHLRRYNFEGTREEVIEFGTKRALMDLLTLIRKG